LLQIHLFGHLRLYVDGQAAKFAALPKTLPLWGYLLLNRRVAIPRDSLAAVFWPDVSESEARANLRRHLHELRRVLPPAPAGHPWLLSDTFTIQWNEAADYWLDVAEFERLCAGDEHLAEAVTLYTGELLPSVYDDWIFIERERLRDLFFGALGRLVQRSRSRHDLPQAIAYAQQILNHDPVREDVVRELMVLRYELGDRAGAFQEYRQFERRLQEELGVSPMPETVSLYQAIAEGQLSRSAAAAPIAARAGPATAPAAPPNNLPAPLTSFIGRETELATLERLLEPATSQVRLVTLTGPGGSGKTRLSIELARRLLACQPALYPDGIFFVGLAAVSNPDLVAPVIAEALGVPEDDTVPLLEVLKDQLRSKRLLLVLDNMEQVVEVAPLVGELLEAAPELRLIATSRILLRLYGEYEFPVEPLALPDLEQLPPAAELAQFAAVALFLERARLARPDFALSESNAAAVAEICVRLDGLPLAIELAAAQIKLFGPVAMLAQLAKRLDFLRLRARNLPERQQTLRATIDWSYNLLDESEKQLFYSLAVFTGVFTLEAAEAVMAEANLSMDVLDGLLALAEKSMIRQQAAREGMDSLRFRMLMTVREYAQERLEESGMAADLRQRHARYYLLLARAAKPKLHGREQIEWLDRLTAEEGNLRAALTWALEETAPAEFHELAALAAFDLARFWLLRSHTSEARLWYTRALARTGSLQPATHVKMLNQTGWEAQAQGDYIAADAYHEQALALARQINDPVSLANTLHFLGASAGRQSDFQRAATLLSESLALARQDASLKAQIPPLLNNLAIVYKRLGDYEQAQSLLENGLAEVQQAGDKVSTATSLANLGNIYTLQGNFPQAAAVHRESLLLRHTVGDQRGLASSLTSLAELAVAIGHYERAARLHGVAERLRVELKVPLTAVAQEDMERDRATLLAAIGEMATAAAWAEGKAMSLEQAIAYALEEKPDQIPIRE
jgi:predicted ATPase/DNA-binding SARP family transcriptional activator/Flp pilus assembly protein TadD